MAIGALAFNNQHSLGEQPTYQPIFFNRISFAGDGAYPTGGTTGFEEAFQTLVGDKRQILSVQAEGGYLVIYNHATDKLQVFVQDTDGGPLVEAANAANLSAITINLFVISC